MVYWIVDAYLMTFDPRVDDLGGTRYHRRPAALIGHLRAEVQEKVCLFGKPHRMEVTAEIERMISSKIRRPAPGLRHGNGEQFGQLDHVRAGARSPDLGADVKNRTARLDQIAGGAIDERVIRHK